MKNKTKHQEYKNIDEQIQYLYDSKKIIVDAEDRHYLEERNYISLVKPYKAVFSTGRNNEGKFVIRHYYEKQCEVPLWVIPNALTLGELQILFMMLDENSQKIVTAKMLKSSVEKMSAHLILSFNGHIEKIRKLRNIINHYEPLLPFLMDEMDTKKIENSQLFNTLNLLYKTSDLMSPVIEETNVNVNSSNARILRILNMMYENVSLKLK